MTDENRYGPYSKEVIDHFKNPRNMGDMDDADTVAKVGSPICGDELWLYLKIGENGNGDLYIEDIKFQSLGCAASVATGSVITEIAMGKTLEEALDIDRDDIIEKLGGLPKMKVHCSMLSSDALHEAIYQYYKKNDMSISDELEEMHGKVVKGTGIAREKRESGKDYC